MYEKSVTEEMVAIGLWKNGSLMLLVHNLWDKCQHPLSKREHGVTYNGVEPYVFLYETYQILFRNHLKTFFCCLRPTSPNAPPTGIAIQFMDLLSEHYDFLIKYELKSFTGLVNGRVDPISITNSVCIINLKLVLYHIILSL